MTNNVPERKSYQDTTDALDASFDNNKAELQTILETVSGDTESLVTATNTKLDTIDANTDNLETLVTYTNTKSDTLHSDITSTNSKLDILHSDVDGVETLIGSTNTKLDTLDGKVDGIEGLITSTNSKLDTAQVVLDKIHFDTEDNNAINIIESGHDKIHSGQMFYNVFDITLGIGTSTTYLFRTGTKEVHKVFLAQSTGEAKILTYEDVTVTNVGTPVPILNRNRTSSTTAESLMYVTPTYQELSSEVLINGVIAGSGRDNGSSVREVAEIILAPNTDYLIIISNETTASVDIVGGLEFYEV